MKILPFKSYVPAVDKIEDCSIFINRVKDSFEKYLKDQLYEECSEPFYYLYKIINQGLESIALITMTQADDVNSNIVKPHEATFEQKKEY